MMTYTATWNDKQTVIINANTRPIGKILFEQTHGILYNDAALHTDTEIFEAISDGRNVVIKREGAEIFTAIFKPVWGNYELQMAGEDTLYDIKGKWFKPGTRLTDADDNDLVVVTADALTGSTIEISATAETPSLMIVATTYFHIRASAAKTLGVMIGNLS